MKVVSGIVGALACLALSASAQAAPGDLDTSFGGSGWSIVDLGSNYEIANAATLDSSGRIVMAGETHVTSSERRVGVARVLPNGVIDEDFGMGGNYKVNPSPGERDFVDSVVELDNQNLLIGGTFKGSESSRSAGMLALDSDGQIASGFGSAGQVIQDFGSQQRSGGAFASGGKIYWYGREATPGLGNPTDFNLIRFNQDGTLDSTFGGGTGRVNHEFHPYLEQYHAVVPLPDGRILIGGEAGRSMDWRIVLLNPDGSLDTGFGSGGSTTVRFNTPNSNDNDFLYGLAVQPDGKIVGVGGSGGNSYISVARMHPDGSLDTSFAGNGKRLIALGDVNTAQDVQVQVDGKIVLAGVTDASGTRDFLAMRLNANGSTDTSFGNGGKVILDFDDAGYWNEAKALLMEPDGDIILVGYAYSGSISFAAARLEGDSAPAPTGDLGDLGGSGGSGGSPGSGDRPAGSPARRFSDLLVLAPRLRLMARRTTPIQLHCWARNELLPCRGLAKLYVRVKLSPQTRPRWVLVGGRKVRGRPGHVIRVPLRVLPRRSRFVRRSGRRHVAMLAASYVNSFGRRTVNRRLIHLVSR